ncbi:hypothetical protein [Archangium lipolyticum]|uniref:hypothetical protein n=1 Tax=Archangium lipolyticum TaxID=2970465 RepID=UPI00389943A6
MERTLTEVNTQRRELTERELLWQEFDTRTRRLGGPTSLVDRSSLERARVSVGARLAAAEAREEELTRTRERLHASFSPQEVRSDQNSFGSGLNLAAELLATRFGDAGIEKAGLLEARLGPLAQALVVKDPVAAARTSAGRPRSFPLCGWGMEAPPS